MERVQARESALDVAGPTLEVEWDRNSSSSADRRRSLVATLAKPLQQYVAAERDPDHDQWLDWMLMYQPADYELEIARLAGMVEASGAW